MPSRRSFLSAAAAVAANAAALPVVRAQTRQPTIDVKKVGAFGDGKLPDLRQVRRAIEMAGEYPAGATVYFPPGEYYLGASDSSELLPVKNLQNIRFIGDRATLSCKTFNGRPEILALSGSRKVSIEGLSFRDYGLVREDTIGAYAISLLKDERMIGCEDIQVKDCKFESVLSALSTHGEAGRGKARGISLTNLSVSRSVYGFTFSDSGDDVVGRNLTCIDVMRSYFPYGVSNHDVELDTRNNATGYTDVLISCYTRDTSNISVKLKSRGKRGGDAIINLDHQNQAPNLALRNIKIEADIDDVDCHLNAAIMFRALDRNRRTETVTNRRWDAISIDGNIRICDKTKLFYFESISNAPGTLRIGPRLAQHPQLPRKFPGFNVSVVRA